MSTRGAVGFQIDGIIKATYNHSDSYPKELGVEVADFLNQLSTNDIKTFKEKIKKLRWVYADDLPSPSDINTYGHFADRDVDVCEPTDWYGLLRETQGVNSLALIFSDALDVLIDSSDFLETSRDCEWGYILNFDECTLDVYKKHLKNSPCRRIFCSPLNSYVSAAKWLTDLNIAIKKLRKRRSAGGAI